MQREAIKILLKLLMWRPDLSFMVMLLAGLCLLYRIEDIWNHRSLIKLEGTSLVGQANAASGVNPKASPVLPQPSAAAPDEKKPKDDKVMTPDSSDAVLKSKNEEKKAEKSKKDEFDPLNLDENQVKILKAMAKKEGDPTIADDRAEIVKKEEMVKIAENKISEQIKQLDSVRKDIDDTRDILTKQEQANVEQMVKIYEGMKPAQAAEVLNKLEITALSQIIKAMKPKKAGLILANMDQAKVRTVTLVLLEDSQARLAQKAAKAAAAEKDQKKTESNESSKQE